MADQADDSKAPERTDVLPPPRLLAGKYRLGHLLGEGGMGAVYQAEHTGLGSRVAIKLLNSLFTANPEAVARFRREARAAAAVRHENIVAVTDIDSDDEGIPFIVMELLEGESLQALIRRERVLEPRAASAVVLQVLRGLAAAHDARVIHRDLKPGNVLLCRERDGTCRVKVLDFGVSKFFEEGASVTAAGSLVGTPGFMAPEQARGQGDLDGRVDLYAAGIMLYLLTTGRLPFSGANADEITDKILEGEVVPPRQHRPDITDALEQVILKAMALRREDRYPDARAFHEALRQAVPEAAEVELAWPSGGRFGVRRAGTGSFPSLPAIDAAAAPAPTAGLAAPTPLGSTDQRALSPTVDESPQSRRSARSRRTVLRALGLGAVAAVGAAAWPAYRWLGKASRPGGGGPALRFGIFQYLPAEDVVRAHAPFVSYLSEQLGRPVKLLVLEDYVDIAEKLRAGELDFAAINAYSYVRAQKRTPQLRAVAIPVTPTGNTYQGLILVRADSGISRLADLKGRTFCYVSPTSTSGYLYPRAVFRREGIDPQGFFGTERVTQDHLSSLRALHSGACDGAAVFSAVLSNPREQRSTGDRELPPPGAFRTLASTDPIPYDAYCVSDRTPPAIAQAYERALLALSPGSAHARQLFEQQGEIIGFVPAKDSDYDGVRRIEHLLDASPTRK